MRALGTDGTYFKLSAVLHMTSDRTKVQTLTHIWHAVLVLTSGLSAIYFYEAQLIS